MCFNEFQMIGRTITPTESHAYSTSDRGLDDPGVVPVWEQLNVLRRVSVSINTWQKVTKELQSNSVPGVASGEEPNKECWRHKPFVGEQLMTGPKTVFRRGTELF